jgi:hypothetical protein
MQTDNHLTNINFKLLPTLDLGVIFLDLNYLLIIICPTSVGSDQFCLLCANLFKNYLKFYLFHIQLVTLDFYLFFYLKFEYFWYRS